MLVYILYSSPIQPLYPSLPALSPPPPPANSSFKVQEKAKQ